MRIKWNGTNKVPRPRERVALLLAPFLHVMLADFLPTPDPYSDLHSSRGLGSSGGPPGLFLCQH